MVLSIEITIVNEYFPPYVTGGAELFLGSLTEFLTKKGHKIKVITTLQKGQKEVEEIKNVEIHRIKSAPFRLGYRYQIPGATFFCNHYNSKLKGKIMKISKNSDILHINNARHLSMAPFQAGKELSCKVILDVHDYWPICFKKDFFKSGKVCDKRSPWECSKCIMKNYGIGPLSPLYYPLLWTDFELREKNLNFDKAICHSKWMSSILPFETKIIPYPIREEIVKLKSKVIGKKLNLLFVGRLEDYKGAHLLPEIVKNLEDSKRKVRLHIMGSGSLENELKKKSEKLPVTFHGWVKDDATKKRIYSNSHILLAPSIWAEPFGIIAIEAMNHAIPSIVSNIGGLSEIVKENGTGVSVKPDAGLISKSISDMSPSEYKNYSKNCIKNRMKYEKNVIMKEYFRFFKKVGK